MSDRIERFIVMAFNDWKKEQSGLTSHPSEEEIVCFLEGKLSKKDVVRFKEHLTSCDACVGLLAADLYLYPVQEIDIPESVLERAYAMVVAKPPIPDLEIFLRIKNLGFEILKTTGDILFGQEFVPVAVLRSRQIMDFKDEVVVVKDFSASHVEVSVQAKGDNFFCLVIFVKDKKTQKVLQDQRVTLAQNEVELESRITDQGKAVFDHVSTGRYSVEVSGLKHALARIVIDVSI